MPDQNREKMDLFPAHNWSWKWPEIDSNGTPLKKLPDCPRCGHDELSMINDYIFCSYCAIRWIKERPSPHELYAQAKGDDKEYLRLMKLHGHVIDRPKNLTYPKVEIKPIKPWTPSDSECEDPECWCHRAIRKGKV